MKASGSPLTPRTLQKGALFCVQLQGGSGRQNGLRLRSLPYPVAGIARLVREKASIFYDPTLCRGGAGGARTRCEW